MFQLQEVALKKMLSPPVRSNYKKFSLSILYMFDANYIENQNRVL